MKILVNKFKIAFIVFLGLLTNCGRSKTDFGNEKILVSKDIPVMPDGTNMGFYLAKNDLEKKLRLSSLEKGVDSLEIRVWHGETLSDTVQMINIKSTNSFWSINIANVKCDFSKDSLQIVSVDYIKCEPKQGWKIFIDLLKGLKITTIPAIKNLDNYSICNDGYGVTIEIGTKDKYRIINYPCYKDIEGEGSERVERVMQFFHEQLLCL